MFQKSIIEKYLSKLDTNLLREKYELFCANYKNETKIANIRALKEEQYQEGFIRDVFCSVLNYTIKPEPNYNILTELKNETKNKNNARKSDGAICEENDESRVRAVIELKGTDTTDLDTVARQAFDYKSHHENCNYAIVCNFERLRLYVETQIEFVEFNLFTLTFEDFCLLYLLLELNQIKNDIPLKLKHETLSEEKQITDNFYADYSTFKRCLFEDMIENNPAMDKLVLFKKTQKLLDRILFVLFCEDRGLLPANSVMGIIGDYQKLKEMGYGQPLYSVFKTYFDRIDKGYKSESDSTKNIFAYNGGLFKPDEILDSLKVGDDVLFIHSKRLADYDFESQISVDILGRIFENSLTEIEEVQKEIEAEKSGEKVENNNVGKRKKDGVFYTPEYITKYIVENTIGKLCEQKRNELNISDEAVAKAQTKKQKDSLNAALHEYQKWLFGLKILDPACGSGAFLTAALTQLKTEHRRVFDFLHAINNDTMMFDEYSDNSILENNLYGVDINEESVEITKLSLWLHTAQKDRKLTTLNNKIKCGNSLIDDPAIASEKAFNWEKEFPEVFCRSEGNKGGFDVVIGNPPYVPTEFISTEDKSFYEMNYKSAFGRINLYPIFYERGIKLLKNNGLLGFITPYTILKNQYYIEARKYILENTSIKNLVDFANVPVFADATVDSIIFVLEKGNTETNQFNYVDNIVDFSKKLFEEKSILQSEILKNNDLSFSNLKNDKFDFDKIYSNTLQLKEIIDFKQGIITGNNKKFITKNFSETCKKVLSGADFNRYKMNWSGDYVLYNENNLHRARKPEIFEINEKLLLRQTGSYPIVMIDKEQFYTLDTVHNGKLINENFSIKFILTLLNSTLLRFLYENSINETGKVFAQVKIIYIDPLPIKNIPLEAQQ
uniref:Eco57I restriction-modification methylase domain-containing protein n=1 Tax=uncultured Treponema sp. TaxID=162155 RepID=UPI0015BDE078